MSLPTRLRLWTIVIIAGVIYLLAQFGVGLYTDYLWFQHLKLDAVFLTGLWAQVGVGLAVAGPVVALFWLNVFIARWQSVQNVLFFSGLNMGFRELRYGREAEAVALKEQSPSGLKLRHFRAF